MKKNLYLFSLIAFFSAFILSCGSRIITGSGTIVSEARSVSGYTSLSFSGAGDVIITQGTTESLDITADDNLMAYIETTVENGELIISFREGVSLDPSTTIIFEVGVINLDDIDFSGAGSIEADSLNVTSGTFTISVSGVSDCTIAGQADQQSIIASGTLTYDAADFESTSGTVNISGVGDITVWVSDTLDVDISGTGDVYYWGSPVVVSDITGLGNVENLGPK